MAQKIISVVLFTVFFSKALTLMCYKCTTPVPYGTCTATANCSQSATPLHCNSFTSTYNGTGSSNKTCSASCANWSVNVGLLSYTSQCCASDLCNNTADSSNGKMCYTCNGTNCSTTLDCKGDEDKCITGTVTLNGVNTTLKGCASKYFCDNYNKLGLDSIKIYNVSCHDVGLLNSAQSLTQGPMLLLVPILPFLFSI